MARAIATDTPGSTPIVRSRQQLRREATSGAILDAAERVALGDGVDALRVEDVAAAAEVSVGSVYFHFHSRQGLVLAVVDRVLSQYEAHQRAALDPGAPAWKQVEDQGHAMFRFLLDEPARYRLLAFPPFVGTPEQPEVAELNDAIARRSEALIGLVADAVERAIEDGSFRPADPWRTAQFLWGAWSGVLALHLRPDRLRLSADEVAEVLAIGRSVIAHGIRALGVAR